MISKLLLFARAVYRLCRAVSKRLSRDCVSAYAGQASFFIIISAIPFLLLLTSAIPMVLPLETQEVLDWLYTWIPDPFAAIFEQISLLQSRIRRGFLSNLSRQV